PEMISDEDISRMAALDKLCPQFHLSLQSGCGKTLKAMNRHYTPEEYSLLCEKLRKSFPGCAITTDIMVGFPQETEEDFAESLEFARKISFADAHIFPYSRRSGTVADRLDGQIDKKTKSLRAQKMSEVCAETKKAYLSAQVGTVQTVLFEKESSPEYHQGHTDSYILVRVPRKSPDISMRREFADVLITSCDDDQCYGTFVEN
ncbi:MAG: radical SAM protein, partial [Oscillospiraceae bacterium]